MRIENNVSLVYDGFTRRIENNVNLVHGGFMRRIT